MPALCADFNVVRIVPLRASLPVSQLPTMFLGPEFESLFKIFLHQPRLRCFAYNEEA